MPLERPSLATLVARTKASVQGALPALSTLRRSLWGALATALAGALHALWGYVAWIARQIFPFSAEGAYLDRWADTWGITRVPVARATGRLTLTGAPGAAAPSGTAWRRADGAEVSSTERGVLDNTGTATIDVEARIPGAAGNTDAGAELTAISPVPGVYSTATVASALTGGAAEEDNESLRARLLYQIRKTPRAGTAADYERWARAASAAVTDVWVRPLGANPDATPAKVGVLGTVIVYFMTYGATVNGIPSAAVRASVDDYIQARRPVTARVDVNPAGADALTAAPLAITIDAVTPDTPAVRAAIAAEIGDLLRREAAPGGTILVSHIREAISTAEGETDHALTVPAADVTHAAHQIATMGNITWT